MYAMSHSEAEEMQIRALEDADYVLEQIADLRRTVVENERVERANIERIAARTEMLNEPLRKRIDYLEGALRAWAEANRDTLLTGKSKSRKLHHGTLGWRKTGGGLRVVDESLALGWVRANLPEAVRTREEIDKAALKLIFRNNGEVPLGCDVEPERDEFYAKPDEHMGKETE